ncbi:hypothetical protein BGZ65_003110 [Modicella reniformis]|uniref:Elongin-A n=1 Tax=Modicella reniformis TaxID=1440133 RepID=A0A9P6SQH1_9FUNG|nr:hypothetical protein BGZ65_003110 [Modicella reniformis]
MAFSGNGHRLDDQDSFTPSDEAPPAPTLTVGIGPVPTLKDICLSVLDRYIDRNTSAMLTEEGLRLLVLDDLVLEDIGTTPYYLIESVLRKCNVKQLTRIEKHTEGLSKMTDELWYIHARNDFEVFRESARPYDHSGEWRSKYDTMKQEVEDKFERRRAQLRQSYSQHDKFRQDRRVIMDTSLRLPKKTARASSSSWQSAAPKKNSLFEKARLEARKIMQMYNSNPYPPPQSRATGSLGNAFKNTLAQPSATVVYTPLSKSTLQQQAGDVVSPSPKRVPAAHNLITPSAPGAIIDFFKEINPAHTRHITTSHHSTSESGSKSPTSPLQSPSKTIQALREDAATSTRYDQTHGNSVKRAPEPRLQTKKVKVDNDYRWLENDDDDDDNDGDKDNDDLDGSQGKIKDRSFKKGIIKSSESLEKSERGFFVDS